MFLNNSKKVKLVISITAQILSIIMQNNFSFSHFKNFFFSPQKCQFIMNLKLKILKGALLTFMLIFAHTCSLSCIVIALSPSHVGHITMEIILTKWTVTRRVIKNIFIILCISWILTFILFFLFQFQVCIENECLSFMAMNTTYGTESREKTKYKEFPFFVGLYKAKKNNVVVQNVMKTYWPIKN